MKYGLVLFDVDSTLIEQEVIDLLAAATPHGQAVAEITARAMAGQLNFDDALRERVALLKGLPETVVTSVHDRMTFSPGAVKLLNHLHENDYLVGVVSGGFHNVLDRFFAPYNLDFLSANTLEVVDGRLSGKTIGPIINRQAKAEALRKFAARNQISLDRTVAIGDGSNDVEMVELAGLGVSFRGKPILNQVADVVLHNELDEIIAYLT